MTAVPDEAPDEAPSRAIARPRPFTVDESVRRIRRYLWVESRLFEVLGSWVPSVPELEAKVLLATHARRRAIRAELWRQRLPDGRRGEPDRFGHPPSPALATFLDALAAPSAPERTIEKLVGVYRVALPHLTAAYACHLAQINPVSDGPCARALELAIGDDAGDRRDGESLVRSLAASADATARAATQRSRLEHLLVIAGGIAGGIAGEGPVGSEPEAGQGRRNLE